MLQNFRFNSRFTSNLLEAELQSVKTELELAIFELETIFISDIYLIDEFCSPSFVFLSFLKFQESERTWKESKNRFEFQLGEWEAKLFANEERLKLSQEENLSLSLQLKESTIESSTVILNHSLHFNRL